VGATLTGRVMEAISLHLVIDRMLWISGVQCNTPEPTLWCQSSQTGKNKSFIGGIIAAMPL